jgi:hypothetical protein
MCGTLTIAVDDEGVAWWLTGGIARRRVRFDEIRSMRTRRIFPLGFGIRTNLAGGWSWIVTGTRAIEIETEDRRTFIVGCDDPDAVVAAIRRHVIIA